MRNSLNFFSKPVVKIMLTTCVLVAFFACNRSFPKEGDQLPVEYPDAGQATSLNRKVLYLILDGAQGDQVKALMLPNINTLLANGIYTWHGISGTEPGDSTLAASWTNLMTGAVSAKTNVVEGFESANFDNYPTFISRMKSSRPGLRIAGFAASSPFSRYLLKDATVNTLTESNDASVAQNVVNELNNPEATLVIGQFHDIARAGDTYGYKSNVPQYAAALTQMDAYIGVFLNTIKQRPEYKKENWMIVVASNVNGTVNQNMLEPLTYFGDTRRNNFVIFNSTRFNALAVPRDPVTGIYLDGAPVSTAGYVPFTENVLQLQGAGSSAVRAYGNDEKGIYDLKRGSQHTLEFKMKVPPNNYSGGERASVDGFYNLFGTLNAQGNTAGVGPGWHIILNAGWGDGTQLFVNFNTNRCESESGNSATDGPIATDNAWHNITLVINWPANSDSLYSKVYVDGTLRKMKGQDSVFYNLRGYGNCGVAATGSDIISSKGKFYIGPPADIGPDKTLDVYNDNCYITDVRYWNVAFNAADVRKFSCRPDIPFDHPYMNQLAAYYKLDASTGNIIKDLSLNKQDLIIVDPSRRASFTPFSDLTLNICPPATTAFYQATIRGVDVPVQIYQWMGFSTPAGLDGKTWNNGYTDVR